MVLELTGKNGALSGKRFAIVVSTYHRDITMALLEGARETLAAAGVIDKHLTVAWVPGAWELPMAAQRLIASHTHYDAVICLGCVIRGETTHDQHINNMVSISLGRMAIETGVPIAFGLLTCNTFQQAIERAGGAVGNKGTEAAEAAMQMIRLFDEIGH